MLQRRRRRPSSSNPDIITWIVVAMVALAVMRHYSDPAERNAETAQRELMDKSKNFFGQYKQKIFPGKFDALNVEEITPGTGTAVLCGQKVSVAYEAFSDTDIALEHGAPREKPLSFTVGSGKAIPALQSGILGMRIGGTRMIYAPGDLGFQPEKPQPNPRQPLQQDGIRLQVELLDASPEAPADKTLYRIGTVQQGVGPGLYCGGKASVRVSIWSMNGKKLYEHDAQKPLEFTIGASEVFLGLEQGVIGLRPGEKRSLVVPEQWQNTLSGDKPAIDIPLPKTQTVLVDVELVP